MTRHVSKGFGAFAGGCHTFLVACRRQRTLRKADALPFASPPPPPATSAPRNNPRIGRLRLPQPGTLIAILALAVAVGGTAYAVDQINGKQIVNRSIKGKKLKKNTVKGGEVKESTLGTVPSAAEAATAADATQAANAATLGGLGPDAFERSGKLRTFEVRASIGQDNIDIATLGPFRLVGRCLLSGGGGTQLVPTVNLQTTENDSIALKTQFAPPADVFVEQDTDFDVGDSLTLAAYQESSATFTAAASSTARMASPSGVGVTLDLTLGSRAFSNNPSARVGCVYTGSAIVDPA